MSGCKPHSTIEKSMKSSNPNDLGEKKTLPYPNFCYLAIDGETASREEHVNAKSSLQHLTGRLRSLLCIKGGV